VDSPAQRANAAIFKLTHYRTSWPLAPRPKKDKNGNHDHVCFCSFLEGGHLTNIQNRSKNVLFVALAAMTLLLPCLVRAQDDDSKGKQQSAAPTVHLTIVVTGGEDKKPVDSASIYVRFVIFHKMLGNNEKVEMNLKTNLSGICHVPEIPQGKTLIQIIAPGWKTFGEYYELNQTEQTVNISLVRPPKWY
jgi:hypothetical protein